MDEQDDIFNLANCVNSECDDNSDLPNILNKNFVETPYYIPEELAQRLRNKQNTDGELSLFHLNIRSMNKNFADLKFFLSQLRYQFSFICLTETWCKEQMDKNSLFQLPNYKIAYQNRSYKDNGGGVCIYIHDSYKFKIREDLSINCKDLESLSVEVLTNNRKNFIVTSSYRPPNGDIYSFLTCFQNYFCTISNKPFYAAGDWNLNILRYDTSKVVKYFIETIFEHSAIPTINKATRVTRKSATAIDNLITNSITNNNLESGILMTDISDHFPIFLFDKITDAQRKSKPKLENNKIYQRSFNQENMEEFRLNLLEHDWSFLYDFNDAEQGYEYFMRIFLNLFNKAFPKKEIKIRAKASEPWITKGLRKSSKRKQRLYENFLRNKTTKNEQIYKKYRNNYNKNLKLAKRLYISDLLIKYRKDIKMTWRTINDLIGKKKEAKDNFPKNILYKGKIIDSKSGIADAFNNFFATIGSDLAKKIPGSESSFADFLDRVEKDMSIKDITSDELKVAISNLEPDKSAGFDEINPRIVKYVSTEIFKPLKYVINLSVRQGEVPEKLKIARVVPVFKDGDREDVSNYRPISILTCFSKIYEKIMYNRLFNHLESNDILYKKQFGFQAKNSTEHAALVLSENILTAFDKNEFLLSLFIDLSKAFDTVDHNILVKKLENYGVRNSNLKWFQSYLSKRKQFVTNGKSILEITHGVPQGSILGPLLFLIYINDIAKCSKLLNFILFADDTTAFLSGKNATEVFKNVNTELPKLQSWFYANKLSLNTIKTKYILFHKANMADDLPLKFPKIFINTLSVERVDKFKFLGIIFDENMSWKCHIDHVEKKLSGVARMIYKARSYLNVRTLKLISDSMAQSYVNYGNSVWASTHHTKLKHIFIKQKQIARLIFFKNKQHHARPLMKKLRALNVYQTNIFQTLTFIIKSRNSVLPRAFSEFFNDLHHKYPTRYSSDALVENICKTKQVSFRISSRGPHLWNSFKEIISNHESLSLSKIKHSLKTLLLDMEDELDYF